MNLLQAIKTCRKLKDKPLDVWRVEPSRYEYHTDLDADQVEYNSARSEIQKYPMIEKLIKRWV